MHWLQHLLLPMPFIGQYVALIALPRVSEQLEIDVLSLEAKGATYSDIVDACRRKFCERIDLLHYDLVNTSRLLIGNGAWQEDIADLELLLDDERAITKHIAVYEGWVPRPFACTRRIVPIKEHVGVVRTVTLPWVRFPELLVLDMGLRRRVHSLEIELQELNQVARVLHVFL